jgi:hypothetical protein
MEQWIMCSLGSFIGVLMGHGIYILFCSHYICRYEYEDHLQQRLEEKLKNSKK